MIDLCRSILHVRELSRTRNLTHVQDHVPCSSSKKKNQSFYSMGKNPNLQQRNSLVREKEHTTLLPNKETVDIVFPTHHTYSGVNATTLYTYLF